jgi:4a-hydroxytetrahydrobiopterin dehydratase
MGHRISAADFHQCPYLFDWRVLRHRAEALFRGASFAQAASFVAEVAAAAEQHGHHPDLDVRHPGLVHVALTTHAAGALTDADVSLTGKISEIGRNVVWLRSRRLPSRQPLSKLQST